MEEKIKEALEGIRPALQADGGDVEFRGLVGKVVQLHLTGACGSCPMAQYTLKQGIETRLKQLIPEIERVEAV